MLAICALLVAYAAYLSWLQARLSGFHAKQVESLLQRIQAPETAVLTHQQVTSPPPPAPDVLGMDDDTAFWQTKEDLAREMSA